MPLANNIYGAGIIPQNEVEYGIAPRSFSKTIWSVARGVASGSSEANIRQLRILEVSLQMRHYKGDSRSRVGQGKNAKLRLSPSRTTFKEEHVTRTEPPTRIRSVVQHDPAMLFKASKGLQALWRSWNSCVQSLAVLVCQLLCRYWPATIAQTLYREKQFQGELSSKQLQVGYSNPASKEYQQEPANYISRSLAAAVRVVRRIGSGLQGDEPQVLVRVESRASIYYAGTGGVPCL